MNGAWLAIASVAAADNDREESLVRDIKMEEARDAEYLKIIGEYRPARPGRRYKQP